MFAPCRLFQQGVEEAKRVINPPLPSISAFSEDQSAELRDRIFDEFNSLAVVYQQPSSSFVRQADPGELLDNALVRFCAISCTPGSQHYIWALLANWESAPCKCLKCN